MSLSRTLIAGATVTAALVFAVTVGLVPAQSQDDGPGSAPRTLVESDEMFAELNNWGRWGDDGERGTANLITPAKSREAVGLVRPGMLVSLSHNP